MKKQTQRSLLAIVGISTTFAAALILLKINKNESFHLPAIRMLPAAKRLGIQGELSPEKISSLLADSTYQPTSSVDSPISEPEIPVGIDTPNDIDQLGYGKSKFLIDSKWATIRFIGENPAGAGLVGTELNRAQTAALGSRHDTIPVTTAIHTINEMMNEYFAPLLKTLPRGEEVLSRIKVQGAYFSPSANTSNEASAERDNAFIVGLQSLYIHPTSCFDKTQESTCSPIAYSAGHDPTIIGHELSHVIFNHIRSEKSLEGWQWFAVNEGYADFFSASYFGDPMLGRVWRVSRPSGSRYLRSLLDTPTTNDPKLLEEGHAFGLIWSSALWRARNQVISVFKAKPSDYDRVILMSINFLGESTKTKLGDAAAAVLKAADVLGYSAWKTLLVEEFRKSEVELARGQKLSPAAGSPIESANSGVTCGSIGNLSNPRNRSHGPEQKTPGSLPGIMLIFPIAALLFISIRGKVKKILLTVSCIFLEGCNLTSLWKDSEQKPSGLTIVYDCKLEGLRDGTPRLPNQRTLSFIFANTAPAEQTVEQIFVGDERFENAVSSLLLVVDKSSMRIDQIRKRDGSLFQMDLRQKYFAPEDALAVQNMRLASIIIEGAGRALQKATKPGSNAAGTLSKQAVRFDITGIPASATINQDLIGARGFGPLANEVTVNGTSLCKHQQTVPAL